MSVTSQLLFLVPMTLDSSRWYFGYSLAAICAVSALAACAFYVSLGGRTLLGDEGLG